MLNISEPLVCLSAADGEAGSRKKKTKTKRGSALDWLYKTYCNCSLQVKKSCQEVPREVPAVKSPHPVIMSRGRLSAVMFQFR